MQVNKTCALAVKDFLQGHLRKMRLWRRVVGERPGIRRSRGKGRPAWFLLGILLLSGDVELNPGPKTGAANKAPPLCVDNVTAVLEQLPWDDVCGCLRIPFSKKSAIESEYSTHRERVGAIVRYWILWDPYASWRMLIRNLDMRWCDLADKIRNYAEKQTDLSLTCHSLLAALDTVESAKDRSETYNGRLEKILQIPGRKKEEMKKQYSRDVDYRKELAQYYIGSSSYSSWNHLAGVLLYYEEYRALQKVKGRINPDKDPSLTLANLTLLLEDMGNWYGFGVWLDVPGSILKSIQNQYSSESLCRKVCWEWYLDNHPSPSWRHVADALYQHGDHQVLEVLKSHYLKGSSESRRLYNEAMKLGHIKSDINKILMFGAPGTGKSSFTDLFVGNPPREVRISTPLAARPVTLFHVDVTGEEWVQLSPKERKRILAQAIHAQYYARGTISSEDSDSGEIITKTDVGSINPEYSSEEKSSIHDRYPRAVHPVSFSSPISTRKIEKVSQSDLLLSISTHDDLVQLMDDYLDLDEALPTFRKLHLIDSGGQPQFHEVLPVFLRRMTLYIFVFKLSEELAIKPMVEYFDGSGKRVGTPYQSAQSNEQLLKHCLRTLNTHRSSPNSKSGCSKIMIVGTHRDKEHLCTTETRKEKNKKLAELLLPTFKNEVIYYNLSENELIFPVNAKVPEGLDKGIAKNIQSIILSKCSNVPVDVPLQYFSLEILLEEVSISLGRGVLSQKECLKAAEKLYFDEHSLDAALQFLDEISVIFYFPEILDDIVFTNPQVLLDKVTELVEKIYCLRENASSSPVHALVDLQKFKDYGIISLDLLQRKEFDKHYVPEIFTPVDLVKLFKKLLIIADFSTSEYIMPALLPVLETGKVNEYCVSNDSPIAPLALAFPLGGPRLGTYCSLVCFLISPDNQFPCPWEIVLLPHSNTPACLNRNCVQFSVPGYPGSVTLIDTFTHFQIHVNTAQIVCCKLCSFVSQAIFTGVKKTTLVLGYNNSIPSKALLCPCGGEDPHIATFGDGVWICSQNSNVFGDLSPRHKLWCNQEEHSSKKGLSMSKPPKMMDIIRFPLKDSKVNLAQEIGIKYFEFGTFLLEDDTGVRITALEKELCRNAQDINRRIFQEWLSGGGRKPVSWGTLIAVLEDIGLSELAQSIAEQISNNSLSIARP